VKADTDSGGKASSFGDRPESVYGMSESPIPSLKRRWAIRWYVLPFGLKEETRAGRKIVHAEN
jgi:hypothetical protein